MTDLINTHPTSLREDLDTAASTGAGPVALADSARRSLSAWADSMQFAKALANALTSTAQCPEVFRGKPADAAAAIMRGIALGLDPSTALESIYVVADKTGLYARSMVSIVLAAGHEIWTEESTPESVTVCGRRRGSEHIERCTWTIQRAQQAGYTSNKKYSSDPQAMLYAKGAAEACRRIAPDALAGMAYSAEDIELESTEPVRISRKRKPKTAEASPKAVEVGEAVVEESRP